MAVGKPIEASPLDQDLIKSRREQIAWAALSVFNQRGYHQTRVRDIAQAAGIAVGTLYEYISTKEDILYLASELGYIRFEERLREVAAQHSDALDRLKAQVDKFYRLMDEMNDTILLIYRESQSLGEDGRRMLMRREEDVRQIFEQTLEEGIAQGVFKKHNCKLVSHNILLLGHMWGLKRWAVRKYLDINGFIQEQLSLLLSGIAS